VLVNAQAAAHVSTNDSRSEITVAGYQDGRLGIAYAELVPQVTGPGEVWFERVNDRIAFASQKRIFNVAGVMDPSFLILEGDAGKYKNDPIVANYEDAFRTNGAASMSLKDLIQLAKRLEEITHDEKRDVVGGEQQIAVFSDGDLKSFDMNVAAPQYPPAFRFDIVNGMTQKLDANSDAQMFGTAPNVGILIQHADINGGRFDLDRRIVLNSVFQNCTLFYEGRSFTMFDVESNKILANVTLKIGANVLGDDHIVRELTTAYPSLRVVRE
jgi:hypothetical protein